MRAVRLLANLIVGLAILVTLRYGLRPTQDAALQPATGAAAVQAGNGSPLSSASQSCTSFCLDNGDHCVFGSNQDNSIDSGLLFVNKRNVQKTGWEPSTTGAYARWVSRYGSVTVVHGAYEMAWGGMNEAGLMISTMALHATEAPPPDARPPLMSSFWAQYQLDSHSTIEEVLASDPYVRVTEAVDHYLVCERSGECAVFEFLEGQMVAHRGNGLPVAALANSGYQESVRAWKSGRLVNNPLQRFGAAADRVASFRPTSSDLAVGAAFDLLAEVALDINAWRLVFDPANLQFHLRTNRNPQVRTVDFGKLDFSCGSPVLMLDVHAGTSGDVSDHFLPYSHRTSFDHTVSFMEQYPRLDYPPWLVDVLLSGLESSPCKEGNPGPAPDTHYGLESYDPLIPTVVAWAAQAILHRLWPALLGLRLFSLAFVVWRETQGLSEFNGPRWAWVLLVVLLGALGLVAYEAWRHRRSPIPLRGEKRGT